MKLPPYRIIFGQKWTISIDDLGDSIAGECYKSNNSIRINNKLNKHHLIPTLLHEMGHAMCHRTGIDQALTSDLEEVIIENFATMMVECFNLTFKKQ